MAHAINDIDDSSLALAWITEATEAEALALIAQAPGDDSRSAWHWIRLSDGTLVLALFPTGESYLALSDSGVCDFGEERSKESS